MSKPFHKSLLGTLIIITLICIGIYWLFFASLGWITGHGKELSVPSLKGKSRNEALKVLEAAGFEVDMDSTFSPDQKPLVVLDQQPEGGTTVKKGRTIFLVFNRVNPPNTRMPNLVNMSYRSAEMLLKNSKLLVGDTVMKPDMAQGAVLSQLLNGKEIAAGTQIPQGSKISLVIGDGLGNKQINVPDLSGMTYPEAVAVLSGSNLNYSAVFDGTISDTSTAVIYLQQPEAFNEFNEPNKIQEGDNVDIRIKQSIESGQ